MKVVCKKCQKTVDVTKHGKVAPHKKGNVRCGMSGRRIERPVPEMINLSEKAEVT